MDQDIVSFLYGLLVIIYLFGEGVSKYFYFYAIYERKHDNCVSEWYEVAETKKQLLRNIFKNFIWAVFPATWIFWIGIGIVRGIKKAKKVWDSLPYDYDDKLVKHSKKGQLSIKE